MDGKSDVRISLDRVCRTCLSESNELKPMIGKIVDDSETQMSSMLEICTSIQLSSDDGLPLVICGVCENKLYSAYKFRVQALKSEDTLRNYASIENFHKIKEESRDTTFDVPGTPFASTAPPSVQTESIYSTEDTPPSEFFVESELVETPEENTLGEVLFNFGSEKSESEYEPLTVEQNSDIDPDFILPKKKISKRGRKLSTRTTEKRSSKSKKKRLRGQYKPRTPKVDPEEVNKVLQETKKRHQEKRECRLCGFISSNARGLSLHIAHIHKEMKNRWCPLCYVEVDDLMDHKKEHSKERLYKCTFCDKSFRAQGHLTEHLRSHSGDRPHKCDKCKKGFLSARHLRVHMRIHTGEKPFECDICLRRFTQKGALQTHQISHTGQKPYKCQVCSERWSKFSSLAEHLVHSGHANEIDPGLLKTAEDAVLKKQTSLAITKAKLGNEVKKEKSEETEDATAFDENSSEPKYIASIVKDGTESKTLCTVCGKTFSSANKLRLHMRVHTGDTPYLCSYCMKRFSTRGQLVVHVRTHTGEKPHVCHVCGKGFAQSSVLNTHMKLHTGRPEQCSVCEQRFCRPAELRLHMRKHTGEKPYLCTECGQAFIQSSHLMEHVKTHSDERPYQCPHCTRAFKQRTSLRSHIQIHTGEKPYRCPQCPYACRQSYSLTQHMRQHGGTDDEKPHSCPACWKRYPSIALLNAHTKSAHQAVMSIKFVVKDT